jgi:hypothetical protein
MNFEACLSLPRDRREARLVADNFDALAKALREWPTDAWQKVASSDEPVSEGLFERLVARAAPAAMHPRQRTATLDSAESVASVLRVLWPEASSAAEPRFAEDPAPVTPA